MLLHCWLISHESRALTAALHMLVLLWRTPGADRPVKDWRSCGEDEFKYKPRLGDAVLFYSLNPDLTINPRALHGGCPVHKGDKWVMTKWIHEKPIRPEGS
jgi:prolyl 4-hydroxylase